MDVNGQSVLFLHVPKTGGSSIERYLQTLGSLRLIGGSHRAQGLPCSPQHLHADALRANFPSLSIDWAFMVVRHPLERLISQYKYQTKKRPWLRNKWMFSIWLRYVLFRKKLNPYYRDNHFRPQSEFEGFSAKVFRFEDGLDSCVNEVNRHLGLTGTQKLAWEKRSRPVTLNLSVRDVILIKRVYAQDYSRYGYE